MYLTPCATVCYNCLLKRYIPCSEHTDPNGEGICVKCESGYHYYDTICDRTCNDCGFVNEGAMHSYDKDGFCRYCGEQKVDD